MNLFTLLKQFPECRHCLLFTRKSTNGWNPFLIKKIFYILNALSMFKLLSMLKLYFVRSVEDMISYKPFFETLEKKNISEYELIFKQGLSANTIHRMKKGEAITTKTLDTLCFILDCSVSEIIEHDKTK